MRQDEYRRRLRVLVLVAIASVIVDVWVLGMMAIVYLFGM